MTRRHPLDADPRHLPYGALLCAAAACERSAHQSDREFAFECKRELKRRLAEEAAADQQRQQAQRRAA